MQIARRLTAIVTAAASLMPLAIAGPAAAFQVGRSPDFSGCNIWFNDKGQPLRNKLGREIGAEVPCAGQHGGRDRYKVLAGEAPGTLVIRDYARHAECVLSLAPGSATVMVPTLCQQVAP